MSAQPACYLISTTPFDFDSLTSTEPRSPCRDPADNLYLLAEALRTTPGWEAMTRAVLVVRREPPALALLGEVDPEQIVQLQGLRWQLERRLPRLRYITYKQAEDDCRELAEKLLARFGRQDLRTFRYEALPRGGFIVLGMLAYVLGLDSARFERQGAPSDVPSDVPLVMVDDCAISGARFADRLRRVKDARIVFAHLYSHPDLRDAIERQEPRVLACVGARDLRDGAPDDYGDAYPAWKERWQERPGAGYWIGQPDPICFAWNEPDVAVWNPVRGRAEAACRIVPPDYCLKNRGPESGGLAIQFQPDGRGFVKPRPATLFGELNGSIVVANLDSGQTFELSGVAGDMWRAIFDAPGLDEAERALVRQYRVEADRLRADLTGFITELRGRGLLEDTTSGERS